MSGTYCFGSAAIAVAVLVCPPVHGQTPENPADTVVVTAGRIEQQITDTIPHTTVITQKEIRESQAIDIIQLLRREAGFQFVQNGGIGSVGSVFMRGTNSTSTLILIDGVRQGSATTGATPIDQIMLNDVDRIEIVRGNVSALYGANAVGGVIQIFTKRGAGAPRANAQLVAGEYGTRGVSANYGGQVGETRFSLSASKYETNGFSSQDPKSAPTRINPDADGYANLSVSGQVSQLLAPGQELGLRFFQSEGRIEYDSSFNTPQTTHYGDRTLGSYALFSNNQVNAVWGSKITLSQAEDKVSDRTDGGTPTRFSTESTELQWQNDIALAKGHVLTATLDDLRQRIQSTTAYAYNSRNVSSLALGYIGKMGDNHLQAAARQDRYSDFGTANTWLAGYGYDLTQDWKLTAMISTAFRAPSLNELFFPGFGNARIQSETSKSNEVGVQYAAGQHLLRIVHFNTRIENLIEAPAPAFTAVNVGKASIEGTELSYTGQYASWDMRASLTLQDPINDVTGAQLVRRARQMGAVVANTRIAGWNVGGELAYTGTRPDGTVTLASYSTVNLTARYDFSKQFYLAARVVNLFDENYQTVLSYNQPRRGLFLTLGWTQ
ncbi:MAG: TonB-dependent receptor [Proteobacteria bacterium]|nr:TonB-dependent receptor [Pseudomonadota bacterium]